MLTFSKFTYQAHAKCIIAGEHSVIRGHGAIVYPILDKHLTLRYSPSSDPVTAKFKGEYADEIHLLFWSVFEKALESVCIPSSVITGQFEFENHIPIGCGLGASAALSVALTQWLTTLGCVVESSAFEFARSLEDLFHGTSSGIDIAGVLHDQPIIFHTPNQIEMLDSTWSPHWYLSNTKQMGMTAHCVKRVMAISNADPTAASRIDTQMEQAVTLAIDALTSTNPERLTLLADAVNKARICFSQWALSEGPVDTHIQTLLGHGALAGKPTGSGQGGFVLSLWDHPPSTKIIDQFELCALSTF